MISNNTLEPISEKREEDGVVPTYTAWDKEERNGVVFRVPRRVSLQPEHLPRTTGNGKNSIFGNINHFMMTKFNFGDHFDDNFLTF